MIRLNALDSSSAGKECGSRQLKASKDACRVPIALSSALIVCLEDSGSLRRIIDATVRVVSYASFRRKLHQWGFAKMRATGAYRQLSLVKDTSSILALFHLASLSHKCTRLALLFFHLQSIVTECYLHTLRGYKSKATILFISQPSQ
jgi:hypothetical protein